MIVREARVSRQIWISESAYNILLSMKHSRQPIGGVIDDVLKNHQELIDKLEDLQVQLDLYEQQGG